MSLLYPDIHVKSVCNITKEMLEQKGITGLIIDIDNTLTSQDGFKISDEVNNWLKDIKIYADCILVSNNKKKRVADFAKLVDLPFVHFALKPAPFMGLRKALNQLGKKPKEVAVVGDQVFTDVIGGNLMGATSIRVEPLWLSEKKENGFKRKLEAKITRKYLSKGVESH